MLFRRSAITIFLLSVIVFSLLPNIFFLTSHSEQVSTTKISSHVLPKIVMFDLPSLEELDDDDNHMLLESVKELIDQADFFLTKEPGSVMEKENDPPSGNKHDFFSLALFWWPDNTKNDSMPYVYRDGVFNPEVYSIPDRKNIHDMIYRVKILSVAYYLTNNTLYASKATELLRVWFLNNDTQMNPNLQFAEVIYGKNNGSASGIITTSYFSEVLDSIKLLQRSSAWTTEDERGIETWFNKYLVWLLDSDFGKREQKRLNNHGTWYDFQTSSIALFLNKTEIVRDIIRSNIEQKIDTKIDSNGSQPYEKQRSKSMDYHIYNLQAFFNLAKIGDYVGIDLWHYESSKGSGLKKAIDYLLPYALSNEAWPYKQEGPIGEDSLADIMCLASKHYESNNYTQIYNVIISANGTNLNSLIYGCITN